MKNSKLMVCLALVLSLLMLFGTAQANVTSSVVVSQILQSGDEITIYTNMLDEESVAVIDDYAPADFVVTLDGMSTVQPESVFRAKENATGTSYVLGFDISQSITIKEMKQIHTEVTTLIDNMRPQDTMSLMTFGSEIATVQNFTSDKEALKTALAGIDRTEKETFLYQGINAAMSAVVSRKINEGRAVIILFTDGMDASQ